MQPVSDPFKGHYRVKNVASKKYNTMLRNMLQPHQEHEHSITFQALKSLNSGSSLRNENIPEDVDTEMHYMTGKIN